jgi:hypothetical protein
MKWIRSISMISAAGCLAFALAVGVSAQKKPREEPIPKDIGDIHIETTPAGFPVLVDGQASGVTTTPGTPIRVQPGTHHVQILFPDQPWAQDVVVNRGKRSFIRLNYVRKPLYSPCPYHPAVTADRDEYGDGEIVTFSADVSYTGSKPLKYTWTLTPASARVLGSADSAILRVDSSGLGGQKVHAALTIDPGYGGEKCIARAEALADVSRTPAGKSASADQGFDLETDKSRLEGLADQIKAKPNTIGYMIYYGGAQTRPGDFEKFSTVATNYLVETCGVDRGRVKVIKGPDGDTTLIELWLVPAGADPPIPTPRAISKPSDNRSAQTAPVSPSPSRSRTVPKKD